MSASPHDRGEAAPRLERDSATGRPVLVAPTRRSRPLHTVVGHDGADVCPFCPGHEAETPPETDAVRAPGSRPDGPGWRARAFRNKYPAASFHEVTAEGPEHQTRPARLDAALWTDVVGLWRRRIAALEAEPGVRCALLFKNVGREAGASIAHVHSQILGLPELPPRLVEELAHQEADDGLLATEIGSAEREGRLVWRGRHHAVFCPRRPKLPFETWLAPLDPAARFEAQGDDADLGASLVAAFLAIDRLLEEPPFNVWLHRVPDTTFHWHFELQPRNGFLAGLELGFDAYINSVDAASAAGRLRAALEDGAPRGRSAP